MFHPYDADRDPLRVREDAPGLIRILKGEDGPGIFNPTVTKYALLTLVFLQLVFILVALSH